jgi:hypothetical protein
MYLHLNWVVICHRKIIWKKAGEREKKLATKNNYVWIIHDLIYVTSSSNGYNIQSTDERHDLLSHRSIRPSINLTWFLLSSIFFYHSLCHQYLTMKVVYLRRL